MPSPEQPDLLDAVVAAPLHHRCAFENEFVRVLETRIKPGETVPLHTHRWPATYYVLQWGQFVRRDASGAVTLDTRVDGAFLAPGSAIWAGPIGPHTLQNVGDSDIHLVSVECKFAGQSLAG